jgi:hypothetical protein
MYGSLKNNSVSTDSSLVRGYIIQLTLHHSQLNINAAAYMTFKNSPLGEYKLLNKLYLNLIFTSE